ncbi:MAG: hypothetical protein A3D15_05500 [Alphaproteobacteria bacterium RIFCSPHIGHO2_02_FULL_40_34]|nr:MAG: hypothetical protein A3D15_05500 [Alphaproteobacteria bacterium RIFCSPHIGHO2_02_FULL_40_34]OFW88807.1 MAG: hypothetical protein A2794_04560 [Alphaproteobacteria bacterium RIFCSPHIGHO2_01_FULL_40_8]
MFRASCFVLRASCVKITEARCTQHAARKKTVIFLIFTLLFLTSSCRLPDNFGFHQPLTMKMTVPDGPPEYKAGWYSGCKTGLANEVFLNAWVYQDGQGPEFSSGLYQHDPVFQTGWGQGWFACVLHVGQFVNRPMNQYGPLE